MQNLISGVNYCRKQSATQIIKLFIISSSLLRCLRWFLCWRLPKHKWGEATHNALPICKFSLAHQLPSVEHFCLWRTKASALAPPPSGEDNRLKRAAVRAMFKTPQMWRGRRVNINACQALLVHRGRLWNNRTHPDKSIESKRFNNAVLMCDISAWNV